MCPTPSPSSLDRSGGPWGVLSSLPSSISCESASGAEASVAGIRPLGHRRCDPRLEQGTWRTAHRVSRVARDAGVPLPTHHVHRMDDGRRVGYALYGDPDGFPVLNCHGGLLSRNDVAPVHDDACRLGARIISIDRPGVALSDRNPGHAMRDWVSDDVTSVLAELKVGRCSVMGWSLGGQYAVAVAHVLPERVVRVAVLAGCPPLDHPRRLAELNGMDRRFAALSTTRPWAARTGLRRRARGGPLCPGAGHAIVPVSTFRPTKPPPSAPRVRGCHGRWRKGSATAVGWSMSTGPWCPPGVSIPGGVSARSPCTRGVRTRWSPSCGVAISPPCWATRRSISTRAMAT